MVAEHQQEPSDEQEQAEDRFSRFEAVAIGDPEDAGGEEAEPDEGGGDDPEDRPQHLEDTEPGEDGQPDPQVLGGRLGGGHQRAAPGGILLGNDRPGNEVGEDPPPGQAAEGDAEPHQRRVEIHGRRQAAAYAAELAVLARPQHLERRHPSAAAPGAAAGIRRRGRGRGRVAAFGRRIGRRGRRRLVGPVGLHGPMIGFPGLPAYRG
jgi:hypothetical protein